ncbi:MAG: hypothetical protein DRJ51_02145 [Thermoprotei archaeon]|nr:MAG: hypothetical protein DRJ51_02145 [Thermoprotei archaeon]RLF03131.1 MAG: hypothetical protein DRJ59_01625 [Thermoprotei archaeon]
MSYIRILYDGNILRTYYFEIRNFKEDLALFTKFLEEAHKHEEEVISVIPCFGQALTGTFGLVGLAAITRIKEKKTTWLQQFMVTEKKPPAASLEEMRRRLIDYYLKVYGPLGKELLEREIIKIVEEQAVTVDEAIRRLYYRLIEV